MHVTSPLLQAEIVSEHLLRFLLNPSNDNDVDRGFYRIFDVTCSDRLAGGSKVKIENETKYPAPTLPGLHYVYTSNLGLSGIISF